MIFGIDFRCVCGILFGRVLDGLRLVLGDFLVPKRWSKGKEPICGNACFTYVLLMFSGVVDSMWGARKTEQQSRIPIWMRSRFCSDFGIIFGAISEAKILHKSIWNTL